MTAGITELGTLFLIAAGLGVLARLLRQPVMLAYLLTGLLVGRLGLFHLNNEEMFRVFADLGIMFLLFLVGLEINYTSLRLVGRQSLVLGLGQIVFTSGIGFLIARFLGFDVLPAGYVAVALMFSSTVIVVKLLSEKRDLHSLYGRLSVGLLLVQDFVAILLLLILAGMGAGDSVAWGNVVLAVLKGALLFLVMLWLGRRVLPLVFDKAARSQELLFVVSIAWLFLVAALVNRLGFSIEIAGFLAGLALANSSEHFEIAGRLKPLRDFFILVFFVLLGSSLSLSSFSGLGSWPIVIFSLFVLIGNPLIVLVLMGLMGYRKRTSFLTGITVAQISEFSLVLAALGHKLGHISDGVVSLITTVGIITIMLSSYLIMYGDQLFRWFSRSLSLFERRNPREDGFVGTQFEKPIILIGAHRTGENILRHLPPEDVLVIEFDPEVVHGLKRRGIEYILGDISDPEIFEHVDFRNARLVISTAPEFEANAALLAELRFASPRPKVIVRAEDERDAKALYERGADYVILPHFTAGQYLGKTVAVDAELRMIDQLKRSDLAVIEKLTK